MGKRERRHFVGSPCSRTVRAVFPLRDVVLLQL